jgi:hypothetical protein
MSEFRFSGAYPRHYPESRDAQNLPVGQVEPGDTRDLDEPLDGDWTPAEDEKPKAKDAPKAKAADDGKSDSGKAATDTKAGSAGKEG